MKPNGKRKLQPTGPMIKRTKTDYEEPIPAYYFRDSLRFVVPYKQVFQVYTKQRWLNRPILSVLSQEFKDKPESYYKDALITGLIRVNRKLVSPDYILQDSDLIEHTVAKRFEPPVTNQNIEIIHQSSDLLIISKPGSLPVHPTGRYKFNTAISILEHEFKIQNLHPVNRIDRLTSGLCIIALTKERAKELMHEMQSRVIHKKYIARVKGDFLDGQIECNEPIATASHKAGINLVSKTRGKPCSSIFRKLSFNGRTSLVECIPKTGRTHQLRVHLQFLGFPIANDPLYCNKAWGDKWGKGGISEEKEFEVINALSETIFAHENSENLEIYNERASPLPEQLQIWLHSYEYSSGDNESKWNYQSTLPEWANEDFDDSIVDKEFWKFGGLWFNRKNL